MIAQCENDYYCSELCTIIEAVLPLNSHCVCPSIPLHSSHSSPFPLLHLVATCANPDLDNTIENGKVSYTRDPTEQGHYVENTTVTVSCDEGYRSSGDIICQNDGNWSSASMPNCTSKPDIICNISVTVTFLNKVLNSSLILLVGCKCSLSVTCISPHPLYK